MGEIENVFSGFFAGIVLHLHQPMTLKILIFLPFSARLTPQNFIYNIHSLWIEVNKSENTRQKQKKMGD